jgi:hypothetical protein
MYVLENINGKLGTKECSVACVVVRSLVYGVVHLSRIVLTSNCGAAIVTLVE